METSLIVSGIAIVTSLVTVIYGAINHKRIKSICCGKSCVTSIDIEQTTPPVSAQPVVPIRIQSHRIDK